MQRFTARTLVCLLLIGINAAAVSGATPLLITHQGRLLDAADQPVTGSVQLTFRIYETPTGGAQLWSEVHPGVSVTEGLFNITLGSLVSLSADILSPASGIAIERWLEVQVEADSPLAPRVQLVSAPYAVATMRVSGDVETQPGSISLGDPLTGSAQINATSDYSFFSTKLRLPTGNAQEGVLTTEFERTRLNLSSDAEGDGVLESELSQISRPTGASLAIKTKGTSAQRLNVVAGATTDSAGVRSGYDETGDGTNETEVTTVVRKAMGRMKCSDVTLERAYLSVVSADSSGSSLSLDSKLNPNAARDNFLQGAADILQARLQLGSDSDNDGVTDISVEQRATNDSASVSTVSRFGSGPRQTTSMDGSFAHSRVTCVSDLDVDGLADNETENFADPATARMRIVVQKHTLEPHEARMSADVAGPRIEISSASTVRASMSLDGVQVSDNSGAVVSEIRSDGNAYIAGNMKFGAVAGAHRIDVEGGAYCDGTNWVNASDANSKENFAKVDGREILNKLDRLDITRWNYKGQADAAHIGPTAQDFREVFGVGSDDKSISTIDPSGIALAAIKELNRQNQELRSQNKELQAQLNELKSVVDKLDSRR